METNVGNCVHLVNTTHDEVVNNFAEITNKLVVTVIQILDTPIGVLRKSLLSGFGNLIDLDLSRCTIFTFENHVFEDLVHLATVNFSNNVINSIDSGLFRTNQNLKSIIFNNNLLHSINRFAFYTLQNLEVLDFSYNHISVLNDVFLSVRNLKKLYLNNNYITYVISTAFIQLPNLTDLHLENNMIGLLSSNVFDELTQLRYLNLNDNRISQMYPNSLWKLKEINSLYLRNNRLTHRIDHLFFSQNSNLFDLDLSDNNLSMVDTYTFDECPNLMFLNLKVRGVFEINSIRNLTSLTKFELFYTPHEQFSLSFVFWGFFKNKLQLTVLKLVFHEVYILKLCDFSTLINLVHLHIEFLKPNNDFRELSFYKCFHNIAKLKILTLKRLNSFAVAKCYHGAKNITHLDLTGVKNTRLDYTFQSYYRLIYLNLSFSEIAYIIATAIENLVHLEHLDLESAKLKFINNRMFKYNGKLRILNFYGCSIEVIQDGSFSNLRCLEMLDLRYNLLKHVSEDTFFGLNRETCNILL